MREPAPAALISAELTIAGRRLVGPVDLEVRRGERLVLMGPNGAGKSLSLRMLHGLVAPTGGWALWDGQPMTQAARAEQAMVFQRPVMLRRSAAANIDYALAARGLPRAGRRAGVAEALARAGLADRARTPARALSGGEQQRLAMARALALKPRLLFLDEPTANLDPAAAIALEDMTLQAHADGVTVVLVTHDAAQARRFADRVAFFHHGRVIEQAAAARFFSDPESDPAQAFLEGRLFA